MKYFIQEDQQVSDAERRDGDDRRGENVEGGGYSRIADRRAPALDAREGEERHSTTLEELKMHLDCAENELVVSAEVMTGRDTYPLIDESARPFDLYVCIEIERMLGAIRHLRDNIHNEIITVEISA